MKKILLLVMGVLIFSATTVFAHCGKCGIGDAKGSTSENWAEKKLNMMTEKLELSEEQTAEVKVILEEKMAKKKAIKEEKKVKMDALTEEFTTKVTAVLNEEQQAKFNKMKAEHDKKGSGHEKKGSDHDHGDHKKGSMKESDERHDDRGEKKGS